MRLVQSVGRAGTEVMKAHLAKSQRNFQGVLPWEFGEAAAEQAWLQASVWHANGQEP